MRTLKKYYTKITFLCLCSLLAVANLSFAEEQTALALEASIMEIDLDNELMIVAEKDVRLLSQMVDGKKVWKTVFVDDKGNSISAATFRKRDRVLVHGEKTTSGAIEAREIVKITEQTTTERKTYDTKSEDANFNKPLPPEIRLEGGVWKN